MDLRTNNNTITISGQIKTMEDYKNIKIIINNFLLNGINEISIEIKDSISVPSSVIGLLLKAIHQDNAKISINTNSPNLIKIFKELNLIDQFQINLDN